MSKKSTRKSKPVSDLEVYLAIREANFQEKAQEALDDTLRNLELFSESQINTLREFAVAIQREELDEGADPESVAILAQEAVTKGADVELVLDIILEFQQWAELQRDFWKQAYKYTYKKID